MHRWCCLIYIWALQVSLVQNFLIQPVSHKPHYSPFVGKPPPPVYLHGPLAPYFVAPPTALRAASSNLPRHSLHVPQAILPGVGHRPTAPNSIFSVQNQPLNVPLVPLSVAKTPQSNFFAKAPFFPNVPKLFVTPPLASKLPVSQNNLRASSSSFLPFHPLPLKSSPSLLPSHSPILNKPSPRFADPRHLHVHHHLHHGGDFLHHPDLISHHHHLPVVAPVHHHHFHPKPHGVLIKKTLIKKFRESENQPLRRFPRALPAVLAAKLATDPKSKVDLMGTLDNVKDATKEVCESIQSPVYHVRDAIGSARDVVFSVLKMSPTGLLVPSTYGIMELKPGAETVSAINPDIAKYVPNYHDKLTGTETELNTNEISETNPGDTLTTVQFMLRNGFRKARDSVQHAGDAVHSMRRAVLTVPRSAVKLLYPFYKSIELQQDRDNYRASGLLGAKLVVSEPTPRLVGAGRLLELLRAASASENKPEQVSDSFGGVSTTISEGKQKYKNFINKIRNDVRERFMSFD